MCLLVHTVCYMCSYVCAICFVYDCVCRQENICDETCSLCSNVNTLTIHTHRSTQPHCTSLCLWQELSGAALRFWQGSQSHEQHAHAHTLTHTHIQKQWTHISHHNHPPSVQKINLRPLIKLRYVSNKGRPGSLLTACNCTLSLYAPCNASLTRVCVWVCMCACVCLGWQRVHFIPNAPVSLLSRTRSDQVLVTKLKQHKTEQNVRVCPVWTCAGTEETHREMDWQQKKETRE